MKTIADLLREQIKAPSDPDRPIFGRRDRGIKACALAHGLPYEEFRKVIRLGHIPKDETLLLYAERLGLDPALLILTAYWERAPECVKPLLLNWTESYRNSYENSH